MIAEQVADVGIRAEDWDAVNRMVRETVQATARVRNLLPRGPAPANRYKVIVPMVNDRSGELRLDNETVLTPIRIACNFKLSAEQIDDVAVVMQLAKAAAQRVAGAEDLILIFGSNLDPAARPPCVTWTDAALNGAVGIDPSDHTQPHATAANAIAAVQSGVSTLEARGYHRPYAAFMLPVLWEGAATASSNRDPIDFLRVLLGEGGGLAPIQEPPGVRSPDRTRTKKDEGIGRRGVVVSLGSGAFDFLEVDPPAVTVIGHGADGELTLRIEERILLRVMDQNASTAISI